MLGSLNRRGIQKGKTAKGHPHSEWQANHFPICFLNMHPSKETSKIKPYKLQSVKFDYIQHHYNDNESNTQIWGIRKNVAEKRRNFDW